VATTFTNAPEDFTIIDVAPSYRLQWRLDPAETEVTFVIQARASGWIGLGFDPENNTMKVSLLDLLKISASFSF